LNDGVEEPDVSQVIVGDGRSAATRPLRQTRPLRGLAPSAKQAHIKPRMRSEHYRDDVFDSLDHWPPFEYGACSG
jgi:hypothetical protein